MDNIYSAYHYSCKTKADREAVEQLKADTIEASQKAVWGNIGDIKYTTRTDVPNGGYWCDGQTITKSELETIYQMLVDGKLCSVDITTYESVVLTNGSCGFFGLDIENQVFKVPTLTDVYIKSGQDVLEFGAESLPNITGGVGSVTGGTTNGAFYISGSNSKGSAQDGTDSNCYMDASRSSSVYQTGAKVNPDYVKYRAYVILFTGQEDVKSIAVWTDKLNNQTNIGLQQLQSKTQEGINKIEAQASDYLKASDKSSISRWGIPDYSARVSISSGFVAPSNGVGYHTEVGAGGSDASLQVYVNGVALGPKQTSYAKGSTFYFEILEAGDVVTWSGGGGGAANHFFFPMKG